MNERKILLFILSVIVYSIYNVQLWFIKQNVVANVVLPEKIADTPITPEENQTTPENPSETLKPVIKPKVIPLFIKDACSILEVFTVKPTITKRKLKHQGWNANNNPVTVIGITVFLLVLLLNAILDVLKVKEEERARRKLNPDGDRRQSLAEFANKKPLRRESSKFGLQLFQIAESVVTPEEENKNNCRQTRPYLSSNKRGDSTNSYLSEPRRKSQEGSAPASIAETAGDPRLVKRQSVAKLFDNKLRWLPQRPVYNYHHCEFRFWRNSNLKTLPYSLWYHMFRDQQTRCLNIGCLETANCQTADKRRHQCKLKLRQNSKELELAVECPSQYNVILDSKYYSPPSLYEICRKQFYQLINTAVRKLNPQTYSFYSEHVGENLYNEHNNNIIDLQENFHGFNIDAEEKKYCDENGNSYQSVVVKEGIYKKSTKPYYVPADVIREYFNFMPNVLISDLSNGPVSTCENLNCKKPVFDHVYYEFCVGEIILIDKIEDVLLSAAFCSKYCADFWKRSKNTIPWTLSKNN